MAASNAEAEAFKAQGNAALSAQKFDEAADLYTKVRASSGTLPAPRSPTRSVAADGPTRPPAEGAVV